MEVNNVWILSKIYQGTLKLLTILETILWRWLDLSEMPQGRKTINEKSEKVEKVKTGLKLDTENNASFWI